MYTFPEHALAAGADQLGAGESIYAAEPRDMWAMATVKQ